MIGQNPGPSQMFSANSNAINKFRASQRSKLPTLFAAAFALVSIGIGAYSLYTNILKPQDQGTSELAVAEQMVDEQLAAAAEGTSQTPGAGSTAPTTSSPSGGGGNQGSSSTPAAGSAPATSAMPQGVSEAISSIERSGLINNSYVIASTEGVPTDVTITVDRTSWTPLAADAGMVSGKVKMSGQTKTGSLVFQLTDGAWKVTGFGVNE